MSFLKYAGAALILSGAAISANATIIDHNTYLSDTTSGLDWLDVTASINMSYNDVSNQLGNGGLFDGWRYATGDEFNTLLSAYTGVANNGYNFTKVDSTTGVTDSLIQLLGDTLNSETQFLYNKSYLEYTNGKHDVTYTSGIIADDYNTVSKQLAMVFDRDSTQSNSTEIDWYEAYEGYQLNNYSRTDVGSYLVRTTLVSEVPEPSSFALLGLGLFSLGFVRRRQKA